MFHVAHRVADRWQFGSHDDHNLIRLGDACQGHIGQPGRTVHHHELIDVGEKCQRMLHRRWRCSVDSVDRLGRIEEMQSGIVVQEKTLQQLLI